VPIDEPLRPRLVGEGKFTEGAAKCANRFF
jgi:hypothetical protein